MQDEIAAAKKVKEIVGKITGKEEYRKVDLKWNDWFFQRDRIMKDLSSGWYIRCFAPRRNSTNEIKMDDPFPPQGDIIIFISIGRSRQNKLAEDVAGQIKKYSEDNCSKFEDTLRIRSVIFHTADEYVEELKEKLTEERTILINIPDGEKNKIDEQWNVLKELKKKLDEVVDSVNFEIFEKTEITDEDILNKWEDLCDICKNGIEKVNDISPKYEKVEARQLAMTMGGYYE